jgi:hypothetical protein
MQETPAVDQADGASEEPPTPSKPVCSYKDCPACTTARLTLECYEASIAFAAHELQKAVKNPRKIGLAINIAKLNGAAILNIVQNVDVEQLAVDNFKLRFLRATNLMNENFDAYKNYSAVQSFMSGLGSKEKK